MAAATNNPLHKLSSTEASEISKRSHFIAGLHVDMLGIDEIPSSVRDVCVLWLHHPRLGSKEDMLFIGITLIKAWNTRLAKQQSSSSSTNASVGLIAVAFDQRNHGTRLRDPKANQAWRDGNPSHAQDMFSTFRGTAVDTSLLMDYLAAYIFPTDDKIIVNHISLGVSLGGHVGWHLALHEPRLTAAVVVIGCADYVRVMTQRAALSRLKTWTETSPPGSKFLGSKDFPSALVKAIDQYDPAGCLMNKMIERGNEDVTRALTDEEREFMMPLMSEKLQGKSICLLSGGADKLVPHKASEPFIAWLNNAIQPGGWFDGHNVTLIDKVYDGVGHEMSKDMLDEAVRFVTARMGQPEKVDSKI